MKYRKSFLSINALLYCTLLLILLPTASADYVYNLTAYAMTNSGIPDSQLNNENHFHVRQGYYEVYFIVPSNAHYFHAYNYQSDGDVNIEIRTVADYVLSEVTWNNEPDHDPWELLDTVNCAYGIMCGWDISGMSTPYLQIAAVSGSSYSKSFFSPLHATVENRPHVHCDTPCNDPNATADSNINFELNGSDISSTTITNMTGVYLNYTIPGQNLTDDGYLCAGFYSEDMENPPNTYSPSTSFLFPECDIVTSGAWLQALSYDTILYDYNSLDKNGSFVVEIVDASESGGVFTLNGILQTAYLNYTNDYVVSPIPNLTAIPTPTFTPIPTVSPYDPNETNTTNNTWSSDFRDTIDGHFQGFHNVLNSTGDFLIYPVESLVNYTNLINDSLVNANTTMYITPLTLVFVPFVDALPTKLKILITLSLVLGTVLIIMGRD